MNEIKITIENCWDQAWASALSSEIAALLNGIDIATSVASNIPKIGMCSHMNVLDEIAGSGVQIYIECK